MVIIEMTPFVFEDGKIYYFQVLRRRSTNDFHDLYVYEKKDIDKSSFLEKIFNKKTIVHEFKSINERPELISVKLDLNEIKSDIKKIINSTRAVSQIKGWDGFVGDVPEDLKQAIKREAKLNSIL
jgi:hypothetical protein